MSDAPTAIDLQTSVEDICGDFVVQRNVEFCAARIAEKNRRSFSAKLECAATPSAQIACQCRARNEMSSCICSDERVSKMHRGARCFPMRLIVQFNVSVTIVPR